jgi:predicted PurR-regulated permease PerM
MKPSEILRMVLAIALISGIGLFLIVALAPYLGAIIGAVIFFFLFAPLQHRLVDKRDLSRLR